MNPRGVENAWSSSLRGGSGGSTELGGPVLPDAAASLLHAAVASAAAGSESRSARRAEAQRRARASTGGGSAKSSYGGATTPPVPGPAVASELPNNSIKTLLARPPQGILGGGRGRAAAARAQAGDDEPPPSSAPDSIPRLPLSVADLDSSSSTAGDGAASAMAVAAALADLQDRHRELLAEHDALHGQHADLQAELQLLRRSTHEQELQAEERQAEVDELRYRCAELRARCAQAAEAKELEEAACLRRASEAEFRAEEAEAALVAAQTTQVLDRGDTRRQASPRSASQRWAQDFARELRGHLGRIALEVGQQRSRRPPMEEDQATTDEILRPQPSTASSARAETVEIADSIDTGASARLGSSPRPTEGEQSVGQTHFQETSYSPAASAVQANGVFRSFLERAGGTGTSASTAVPAPVGSAGADDRSSKMAAWGAAERRAEVDAMRGAVAQKAHFLELIVSQVQASQEAHQRAVAKLSATARLLHAGDQQSPVVAARRPAAEDSASGSGGGVAWLSTKLPESWAAVASNGPVLAAPATTYGPQAALDPRRWPPQ